MKVSELFYLYQGNGFELANMDTDNNSNINFIARTEENNGVVAKVKKTKTEPFPKGAITVALNGSVLSSFVQIKPFYTAFHIMVLIPKKEMRLEEKLYYCMCIKANAYRYLFGRQANKTLKNIELPNIPNWLKKYKLDFAKIKTKIKEKNLYLNTNNWKKFIIGGNKGLFDVQLSKGDLQIKKCLYGNIPLISSGNDNNGNIGFISEKGDGVAQIFSKDTITVDMFGKAYYQPNDYFAVSHGRVNVLIPKFKINKEIGLFIVTMINNEQYRFEYGRAVYSNVISDMIIKLPATNDGKPDWEYMEEYIKSLPNSDLI